MQKTVTPDILLQDRFRGAIIGTMVGDTLGADVEGTPAEFLHEHLKTFTDLDAMLSPGGMLTGQRAAPGTTRYTDDTQMTLGIAETLSERGTINEADLARRFAANFEGHRGYGPGAAAVLQAIKDGAHWSEPAQELFHGSGSFGNGAAMRAAPVGAFFHQSEPHTLRRAATRSAIITHTHLLGIEGAVLQAAAVAQAIRAALSSPEGIDPLRFLAGVEGTCRDDCEEFLGRFDTIRHLLHFEKSDPVTTAGMVGNGIEAFTAVPAALCAFLLNPNSFTGAVRYAILMGGDTDTIGAMCGAIAGAYHGYSAIPEDWLSPLENGAKGRDYALQLADSLFERWQQEHDPGDRR